MEKIREYFFDGLLILMPAALTLYVTLLIFQFIRGILNFAIVFFPEEYRKLFFVNIAVEITTGIILILFIILSGWGIRTFIGKAIQKKMDKFLAGLPGISAVYKAFKKFFEVFFAGEMAKLSRPVLIEYPHREKWVIGFVTGKVIEKFSPSSNSIEEYYTVFMPTTPNPTTGFLMIVPKKDIIETNMTIDEALKLILSGGVLKD